MRQLLLFFSTKFYIVYKDSDREQKMISTDRYVKSKCYHDTITGLEVCGEIQLPPFYTPSGPLFPLTGPTQFKVVLNKKDTLRGFHFETKFLQEKVFQYLLHSLEFFNAKELDGQSYCLLYVFSFSKILKVLLAEKNIYQNKNWLHIY